MGRLAEMQRKLLEQLMGPEAMGIANTLTKFTDPRACRSYLAGVCPHDVFVNTREDMGTCPKTHSDRLKEEFEVALKKAQEDPANSEYTMGELNAFKYENERIIQTLVADCDRTIARAQKRLEMTPEESKKAAALITEIQEIGNVYQLAIQQVEALGEQGDIDASMAENAKAEALNAEKLEKERELKQLKETAGASGHQHLNVCEICGAYLSSSDNDRRLADHFQGKLHVGYDQLRQMLDAWRKRGPLEGITASGQPNDLGDKQRSRDKEESSRHRDDDRARDRDRDHRDRHKRDYDDRHERRDRDRGRRHDDYDDRDSKRHRAM